MQKLFSLIVFIICAASIAAAQNVGIGTTAPTEKLHVAGNIKADTLKPNAVKITANAGDGKLLTSDAAGNASWQERSAVTPGTVGFGSWGDCSMNNISEYNPVADTTGTTGDFSGLTVAISGNFAIVGAPQANDNIKKGYAVIYQFIGSNWIQMQKLTDPNAVQGESFGFSVSISGNFAVVGAPNDSVSSNPKQGSACIFQYNGTSWIFKQKLTDINGAANDNFGNSVSLSGNDVIVASVADDVGANTDQGSVIIFHNNGTSWALTQKIVDATGGANDQFGKSVSISDNFVIVGAPGSTVNLITGEGSASIYKLNGTVLVLMKKITNNSSVAGNNFGSSVSISGNYAVVGANAFGGPALIFQLIGTDWIVIQKLTDDTNSTALSFGISVSISGNFIVVGKPIHNNSTGAIIIFSKLGSRWDKLQFVTDPRYQSGDDFGYSVSIDGTSKRFLIGAPVYGNFTGKAVFGKIN